MSEARQVTTFDGIASEDLEDKKKCRARGCEVTAMARSGSLFSDMGMDRTFFKLFFSTRTKVDGTGIPLCIRVASGGSNLRTERDVRQF